MKNKRYTLILCVAIMLSARVAQANDQISLEDLYAAVDSGNVENLQSLLDKKPTSGLSRVLGHAVQANQLEMAKRLLAAGADPRRYIPEVGHPLIIAMMNKNLPMIELLAATKKIDEDNLGKVVSVAVAQDFVPGLKALFEDQNLEELFPPLVPYMGGVKSKEMYRLFGDKTGFINPKLEERYFNKPARELAKKAAAEQAMKVTQQEQRINNAIKAHNAQELKAALADADVEQISQSTLRNALKEIIDQNLLR